jgi:hypothetical protein
MITAMAGQATKAEKATATSMTSLSRIKIDAWKKLFAREARNAERF